MRFADFYAGAGGWTLGLSLSGHESVISAEIWPAANRVRAWNLGCVDGKTDVRALEPETVPDVDLIVGSPPCTQFSYANKGGNGNIADGMEDVRAFLRIVRAKNPRYWVMENVPRLTGILETELRPGGALAEFSDLFGSIDDFDMSDWGVPQRRRRCVAGKYPRDALLALRGRRAPTLAEVVAACAAGADPVWGGPAVPVTDNDPGASLTWEEARINREKKRNHPIYNDMAFPDHADRPARTVTATCTKVSRESIVVPDGAGFFRLLSVRESAAVQSFPLSYQFASGGRSDRIKMAGNAIPPLFTYMVGLAVDGREVPLTMPSFEPLNGRAEDAAPESSVRRAHRPGRAFRAAVAELRFKSGMSFEIRNGPDGWRMAFNAGGPGRSAVASDAAVAHAASIAAVTFQKPQLPSPEAMQAAWEAALDCESHPFRVADRIGAAATGPVDASRARTAVEAVYESLGMPAPAKALLHSPRIAAGLAIAAHFNAAMSHGRKAEAA